MLQSRSSVLIRLSILCILSISLMWSCKKKPQLTEFNEGFKAYIYAYTSGVISRSSDVKIRFTQSVVDEKRVGEPVAAGVLSISPNIEGTAIWETTSMISFQPKEFMPSNTEFFTTIDVRKLYGNVPDDLNKFLFDFRTKEQNFEVLVEGLRADDVSDLTKQKLVGTVYTADVAKAEKVEKILSVNQSGNKDLNIVWEHDSDQLYHHFIIENINRVNTESNVNLKWNGNALSVSKKGLEKVEVPALGDFKLTNVRIVQDADQHILLEFSDPLLKSQDLTGLISVVGSTGELSFAIDANTIRMYPASRLIGDKRISVTKGIKNSEKQTMRLPSEWTLSFAELKPKVRLVGNGVILPNSDGLVMPFEAVSLEAVDVEVLKIYENNILQFLQNNEVDGNYQLERVGRIILQKKIPLQQLNPTADFGSWTRYALDLNNLLKREPNAIYQIRIGFQKEYSTYFCSSNSNKTDDDDSENSGMTTVGETKEGEIVSFWDKNTNWYSWDDRDDPCKDAYYYSYDRTEKFARQNIIASDLGLLCKKGEDGSYFVVVSNLVTAKPISGIDVKFYDYQQQVIKQVKTDSEGMILTQMARKPYFLVAEKGLQRGYIKLRDGHSLSLSRFDISGEKTYKGLKGYLYGERGVWRPGDTLHLTFALEDKLGNLPKSHPVTFELYDPKGQLQEKTVKSDNVNGLFDFTTQTTADAPTGNWRAKIKVGGATFEKRLKIETVKPNRLKIKLDFGTEALAASDTDLKGKLQVNWLHGAVAKNVKTVVKVRLNSVTTKFKTHNNFAFDDPARNYEGKAETIFEANVDANGKADVGTKIAVKEAAPGQMKANFSIKAFEKSGDFSTDNFSMPYDPYDTYTGVQIPRKKSGEKRLDLKKSYKIQFATLTPSGKAKSNRKLNIGLYKVNWRWWWDSSSDNVSNYSSSVHKNAIEKATIRTNSKGLSSWNLKVDGWGRYMIRVCDEESGHCSGDFFYAGYPWYDDNDGKQEAAAMLAFSSDKDKYNVGETVRLKIPNSASGRALITIENGSRVIESYWKSAKEGENVFSFSATKEMTPNVYAHVTLIQPHGQLANDRPIRMYGVIPIGVENPKTRLKPEIKVPETLEPNKVFAVNVRETSGQPMAYTIAVVDDGLLDLTRYKTPNLWNYFYAREALGVKTWDVYSQVVGAYGGKLERILSIGGDDALGPRSGQKANRFKPVVMHLGPYYLKKGQRKTHKIQMPNYVGSVRTMIVAANKGAYGSAEVNSKVKKSLMVLGTLPRVLGPGETLQMPVTVFAMDKNIKNVKVKVETNGLFELLSSSTERLTFAKPDEKIVKFDLRVRQSIGVGKVKITVTSGNEKAVQEIELDVRNPNPHIVDVTEKVLEKGKSWTHEFSPVGIEGTNTGVLELSNIPPLNLGERLDYLIQYPHGCIEQTTSSGFPQLYVNQLLELPADKRKEVDKNLRATIDRLKKFQVADGGFAYWPGNTDANEWGSTYAGHFILEAKKRGFTLPPNMVNRWKKYQKKIAKTWSGGRGYRNSDLMQAYRLYTLAMADSPEWGAMNRMREQSNLSDAAKWRLAAAYAIGGKKSVAQKITNGLTTNVKEYKELSYTYGSDVRDMAMILETLTVMKDQNRAAKLVQKVSKSLSSKQWHSTQTVSYALLAVGKYVGNNKLNDKFTFRYQIGSGEMTNSGSSNPIFQQNIDLDNLSKSSVKVANTSKGVLFARLILKGQPSIGDTTSAAKNLNLAIQYKDLKGGKLNPKSIEQGTDFIAEITVSNPGTQGNYQEMALSQIFPSGWEIINSRMNNVVNYTNTSIPEYQDIRDDRVYSYFDIKANSSQVYRIQLNATYQGRYYLPTVYCEAMYDNEINARQPGQWVQVVEPTKTVQ